jgi:hypothetical protein
MKKQFRILTALLSMVVLLSIHTASIAQPHPSSQHGTGVNQDAGGGAPVGNGTYILLTLVAIYALRKEYALKK